MSTTSVYYALRPPRIGWLVESQERAQIERAMQLSHMLWGGRFNPILPVDLPDYSRSLVRLFGLDVLHPLNESPSALLLQNQYDFLKPPYGLSPLVGDGPGPGALHALDVAHPIRALRTADPRKALELQLSSLQVEWEPDDPLASVLRATVGAFDDPQLGTYYREQFSSCITSEHARLVKDQPLWPDLAHFTTPGRVGSFGLQYGRKSQSDRTGIFVGNADNGLDIVTYWNLRAAGVGVYFFDPSHETRLTPMVMEGLDRFRRYARGSSGYTYVWSRDADVALPQFLAGQKTVLNIVAEPIWNGLSLRPPVPRLPRRTALGNIDESAAGKLLVFEVDEPALTNEPRHVAQYALVEIFSPVGQDSEEETTFVTPNIPKLNPYFGREMVFGYRDFRVGPEGCSIFMRLHSRHVRLRALSKRELVTKIFEAHDVRATPSKAGLVATRMIQQMGGIQGCRVFKIEGVRRLIRRFRPTQSFGRSDALKEIGIGIARYSDLYIAPRNTTALRPENALELLLERGVLRTGAEFACPNCLLTSWSSIDDIKTQLTCELCGHTYNCTPQLRDRHFWRYRRSGLFGMDDHQEGGIPVVVALQQLDTTINAPLSWKLFVTGTSFAGANISPCEADFICLSQDKDGRVEIGLGEAKASMEITRTDIENLRQFEAIFPREEFRVFGIFAKTGDFSPSEITRFSRAEDEGSCRTILLGQRELDLYDHALEQSGLAQRWIAGAGLEGLAEISAINYLRPAAQGVSVAGAGDAN